MIYVMSDIHGMYDKYQRMLSVLDLKDEDQLYILGDVVDRGPDGIKIYQDMMEKDNIVPLMGNHEWSFLLIGQKILDGDSREEVETLAIMGDGLDTYKAFMALGWEMQSEMLDYVRSFSGPMEVRVNGNDFLLSHTAPAYARASDWKNWSCEEYLSSGDLDYRIRYYEDKYLITGHTPTGEINPDYFGKIWHGNGHIAMDCAASYKGGRLGCICLDTMEEGYV